MNKVIFLIALAGITVSLSCRKSAGTTGSTAGCQVTNIQTSGAGAGVYAMTYNSDGKLATMQYSDNSGTYSRKYTYGNNLIVVAQSSVYSYVDSVYLDGNGNISYIDRHDAQNNTSVTLFTYDSNGQLTKTSIQANGSAPLVSTYKYINGDPVEIDAYNTTITSTYYTDKPVGVSAGAFYASQWLQYGVAYQKSAHLVKSQTVGTATENISYTFDADGKVTSMTIANNSTSATTQFAYDCH